MADPAVKVTVEFGADVGIDNDHAPLPPPAIVAGHVVAALREKARDFEGDIGHLQDWIDAFVVELDRYPSGPAWKIAEDLYPDHRSAAPVAEDAPYFNVTEAVLHTYAVLHAHEGHRGYEEIMASLDAHDVVCLHERDDSIPRPKMYAMGATHIGAEEITAAAARIAAARPQPEPPGLEL